MLRCAEVTDLSVISRAAMAILRPCNNCPVPQGVAYISHTVQWCVVLYVSTVFTQVACLTITAPKNPTETLVLGNSTFSLTCDIDSEGADVFGTELARKRESENEYVDIVSFPPPNVDRNITYLDFSIETRTTAVKPMTDSLTASLTLMDIVCTDKASYRWTVNYYDTQQRTATATTNIESLKALSTFRNDGQVLYSPHSNIKENDMVNFTCQGNVGNVPIAELVWFLYRNGATSGGEMQTHGVTTNPPTAEAGNPCSYRRSSLLRLAMASDMDGAVVRCTAQQDIRDEDGDNGNNYKQTGHLSVRYSVKGVTIKLIPSSEQSCYREHDGLTFNCSAVSNPDPTFYWTVPASSSRANAGIITEPIIKLENLQLNDTGTYTCIAQNIIDGTNYTVNANVTITVYREGDLTITTSPAANGTDLYVTEGQRVTINCSSRGGHPAPNVSLHSPALLGSSSKSQESEYTYSVVWTATFNATPQDDEQVLTCLAYWPSFADACYRKNKTLTVHVSHSVNNVTIKPIPSSEQGCYREQDELALNCSAVSNPDPTFHWTVPASSSHATAGSVLQFQSLKLNDTGTYTCIAQNTINVKTYTANANVTITVYREGDLTITASPAANGADLYVTEGQPVTINCTSRGGHPVPNVTLQRGGAQVPVLQGSSPDSRQESDYTYSVTQTATFAATRQDDGQVLTCFAYVPSLADVCYRKNKMLTIHVTLQSSPDTGLKRIWVIVVPIVVVVIVIIILILVILVVLRRKRASKSNDLSELKDIGTK